VSPWRGGTLAREGKLRENNPALTTLPVDPDGPQPTFNGTRGSLRTERINRVREQIRQGTYNISAAEVAKAILQSDPSRLLPKKKKK
jgi:anti-sigma-28 factor FlgM